jgi:hypothetical protein
MKTLILAAIRCSLMFLIPTVTYAISAQWDLDPISGDWNTAANWTPDEVPNRSADIATFDLSNTTDVSLSAQIFLNGITFTSAATNPYTITANPNTFINFTGVGITNNSGTPQNFVNATGGGELMFHNRASAGSSTNFTNKGAATVEDVFGGLMIFAESSTADNGTFTNDGAMVGRALGGLMIFLQDSTAANGTFANNGATVDGALGGQTIFRDNSKAGSATLIANGGTNDGLGGKIVFEGNSDGGTSQVEVFGNGTLDLSNHNTGVVTIGSIAGSGRVFLGEAQVGLSIGGNNLNTTFSGAMGGRHPGADLAKVGTGTLTFAEGSEIRFFGDIEIDRGVLQVDGFLGQGNTFVHEGATLAGSGTVESGTVEVGAGGTVMPGSAGAPGTLTIDGRYAAFTFATLMIQIASDDQFSVLQIVGRTNTALLGGTLEPVLLNGFIPEAGDTFAFLLGPHEGEFDRIVNENFWVVDYEDPTMVSLRVRAVPGGVPDQGSTFLLLMLGLLGLVTCRRRLLRGQP